jgi:hypothetical protein
MTINFAFLFRLIHGYSVKGPSDFKRQKMALGSRNIRIKWANSPKWRNIGALLCFLKYILIKCSEI